MHGRAGIVFGCLRTFEKIIYALSPVSQPPPRGKSSARGATTLVRTKRTAPCRSSRSRRRISEEGGGPPGLLSRGGAFAATFFFPLRFFSGLPLRPTGGNLGDGDARGGASTGRIRAAMRSRPSNARAGSTTPTADPPRSARRRARPSSRRAAARSEGRMGSAGVGAHPSSSRSSRRRLSSAAATRTTAAAASVALAALTESAHPPGAVDAASRRAARAWSARRALSTGWWPG